MFMFADVALNLPLETLFTYMVEDVRMAAQLEVGKRVLVPFRGRQVSGYLISLRDQPLANQQGNLLPLTAVVDQQPLFSPAQLAFYRRAAAYYQTPFGVALHALLPGGLAFRSRRDYVLTGKPLPVSRDCRRQELAAQVVNLLQGKGPLSAAELEAGLTGSKEQLAAMLNNGVRQGWLASAIQLLPPLARERTETIYEIVKSTVLLAQVGSGKMRPEKRQLMAEFLGGSPFFSRRQFLQAFPGSSGALRRWQDQELVAARQIPWFRTLAEQDGDQQLPPVVVLTKAQEELYERMVPSVTTGSFSPFLLHGVTGSGKTEIYLKLIKKVLSLGRGALYLVPEIALTVQLLHRMIREFGDQVAVLHSSLGAGERYDQWRRIKSGSARVVLGARSAVFAPLTNLGLIVVDEEHEPSYKQESAFPYHGRDLALMRAQMTGCPVVMGSATPAVTTYYGAISGRYRLLELPERLGGDKQLPRVEVVDLGAGKQKLFDWDGFSPQLLERMTQVLDTGRQVMLFLNKRGFSRTLYCLDCGHMPSCRSCSVRLTFHKEIDRLVCHYCGLTLPAPKVCPQCHKPRLFPLGVGIQKLAETLEHHFPAVKIARLDRDTTRKKGQLAALIHAFAGGEYQILLGTQMLAKGLHFPNVDLVGVIFADLSLNFPDFTAAERTFQLLTQVAGRSGRGDQRGLVLIQTLLPRHYSIQCAARHDYQGFFALEYQLRQELKLPPASYLVLIRAHGADQQQVVALLGSIRDEACKYIRDNGWNESIVVMGPVPASVVKIKNRFRWHLLLKGIQRPRLHQLVGQLRRLPGARQVTVSIDIDPLSFA
ncbi:MAG: primosomal protein N' [Deltaproteobacteria bacterium]|nr:primosomal protein N' [Candidatus Anaeroferrophillus wilburensis]MBN2888871.1 primosomal protein N' [Deltaproteobacteria bacterium]